MATSRLSAPAGDIGQTPERRLFQKYNRTLWSGYAILVAALAGFFSLQMRLSLQDEVQSIEDQVERHGQFLDWVLRASVDQVEVLRSAALAQRMHAACAAGQRQVAEGPLTQTDLQYSWSPAIGSAAGASLVGQGILAARPHDFYCDLGAALALIPQLSATAIHSPAAGRAHFVSAQGFHLEAPWRPMASASNGRQAGWQEVLQAGRPAVNPDRRPHWGAPYFGGLDVGLLVPVAAPVDAGHHFIGVAVVDLRLEYFNKMNSQIGNSLGTVSVVDSHGRVLAHPAHLADPLAHRQPGRFEQAFSPEVLGSAQDLLKIAPGKAVEQGGSIVIRRPFLNAPWHMVYVVPQAVLWRKLLFQRGPGIGVMLVTLSLLMVLTYWVTWRGFIGPATKLVGHVVAESNLQPQPLPPVPPDWRPWFESITRVFRESLQWGSLRREVDIASRMQQSILPRQWPQQEHFELWGTMKPARDVGGDFYDHFQLPDGRHGLVVADVSGKGISAGLFGMVSKTLLRAAAIQRNAVPGQVAADVNDALCADNESSMFVTTFLAHYDPATGRLVYVNAGHPPPLVVRANGALHWLPFAGGTAFGVVPGLSYQEGVVDLAPGDTLLAFTDGVTESINAQGQEFGKTRLSALFDGQPAAQAHTAIERILRSVDQFAQGVEQFDDIACMALRCRRVASVASLAGESV